MPFYRKRPLIIEAVQYTGNNWEDILKLAGNSGSVQFEDYQGSHIRIETLEGTVTVQRDDWVIKGIKGESYMCKPDIFTLTYELVDRDTETNT